MDRRFFCNSGTEANEAAIKLARLHTPKEKYKIITFEGGFHGRTLGSLTATAQPKYHEGLGPLVAGFVYAPFGDLDAVSDRIDDETCAIMIEPIQGEGGCGFRPASILAGLRRLADEHGLLLIFDEVQTGCGRTGRLVRLPAFRGHPRYHDAGQGAVRRIGRRRHAGHPRGCPQLAARHARVDVRRQPDCGAGRHRDAGDDRAGPSPGAGPGIERSVPASGLRHSQAECPLIREVRIVGLMIGIELSMEGTPVVEACLQRRLLINCTHNTVLRLLPAMTLTAEQVDEGCDDSGRSSAQRCRMTRFAARSLPLV